MKEMDEKGINLPATTKTEIAFDTASIISGFAPWIGGPIGNVLAGMSMNRKMARIETCLKYLEENIEKIRSASAENFVKTEDFEDLLERTLKKVYDERYEDKRKIYGRFIINNIAMPNVEFDERLKMLKLLEELQPTHIELIKALLQNPAPEDSRGNSGSILRTLSRRLSNYSEDLLIDLVKDLEQSRLIVDVVGNLKTGMSSQGAADLRSRVTDFGRRFVGFLIEE